MSEDFGIIGFGNHAHKLIKIFLSCNSQSRFTIYIHRQDLANNLPEALSETCKFTNKLDEMLKCNSVLIISPNNSHFSYLSYLIDNNYGGYIFCEKPPVTSIQEVEVMENLSESIKNRIYFNFNFRYGSIYESIKNDSANFDLGILLNATIIKGHGLALKETYKTSWRSKKNEHKGGVFETVSVHYLDLFMYLFGPPNAFSIYTQNVSPYGDSIDNSNFSCTFNNKLSINIISSYTSPLISEIVMIYDNGIVKISDTLKEVYSPRNSFNSEGFFVSPKPIFSEPFRNNSLEKSIFKFLDIGKSKSIFSLYDFNASLAVNRKLIEVINAF